MGITRDYFSIQKHFQEKYGEHTCLLIQIGSFYEIYEYDPNYADQTIMNGPEGNLTLKFALKSGKGEGVNNGETVKINTKCNENEVIGHALDISLILNMKLTSKCKDKPHTMDNPMMVGFPCPKYEDHRDLILFHGFTIVRIDQKDKTADSENVEREVVEISSPGTEIDNHLIYQPSGTNTIVSIYIECQRVQRNVENNVILCGLSSIDVSTGRNIVCEIYSKENDEIYAIQEIYRFLTAQNPIEVMINVEKIPITHIDEYMTYLNNTLELDRYNVKIVKCNQLDSNYMKSEYQEEIFRKAFGDSISENVKMPFIQPGTSGIEYQLDLENFTYGRISYVTLLQYCYEHNENIIQKLQKPQVTWTDQNKHLVLAHNAMLQLDLFPKKNNGYLGSSSIRSKHKVYDSLISVVDSTSTSMGARYLRRQLLNPILNEDKLKSIYGMTEELINDETLLNTISNSLKKLPDFEKFQRKIQISLIRPKEFVSLCRGYLSIQQIYITLFNHCFNNKTNQPYLQNILMDPSDIEDFNITLNEIMTTFNIDKLDRVKFTSRLGGKQQKIQCDESFIHPGCDLEIDQLQNGLQQYRNYLYMICEHLNSTLTGRVKKVEPIFERSKSANKNDDDDDENSNGELSVNLCVTSSAAKQLRSSNLNYQICGGLTFHEINKTKTVVTSDIIRQCCSGIEMYQTTLEQRLLSKFYEYIGKIAQKKYFSGLNNFVSSLDFIKSNAQIAIRYKYYKPEIKSDAIRPFINVDNLRHPLIERIIRTEYITNDIHLGETSLLLFGINSSGKSSLAKALGCIVMMAQAGLYVPGKMVYKPFSKIITRLSGEDNLLKGQSSFIVEMTELRTILRNADDKTLVLGDELCRGTESLSGTSLTVATIQTLLNRHTKFIFSTHMHHLPKIDKIKEYQSKNQLRIAHLTATYDEKIDRLVYNRQLEEGAGSSQYGLEVCKSLSIDRTFIDLANNIRRHLDDIPDLFHSMKKSKYNRKIYIDMCQLCGSKSNLHTHHIQEQQKANKEGFIDHYHKNSQFNLLVLCQHCHQKLHHDGTHLIKKETLEGTYITTCPSETNDNLPIISASNLEKLMQEKLSIQNTSMLNL